MHAYRGGTRDRLGTLVPLIRTASGDGYDQFG